jgi:hypothetical protein
MSQTGSQLARLLRLHDREDDLDAHTRMWVYNDLLAITKRLELEDVQADVVQSVLRYHKTLREQGSAFDLALFEDTFQDNLFIPSPTVYNNPQNVHVFATPTARAARRVIRKHPAPYFRPAVFLGSEFDFFFDTVATTAPVFGVPLTRLFASVWHIASSSGHDLVARLVEEVTDCRDVCLVGYLTRLVNTLSGTDINLGLQIEQKEYAKSWIFHQINKHVDVNDISHIPGQVQHIINNLVDTRDIPSRHVLYALGVYTKTPWSIVSGKYRTE